MVNVTEYLKERSKYDYKIIHRFLRTERVKYFIGHETKVISKKGRHNSFTLFKEDLFEIFLLWLDKKPIPLLNRKEYEVSDFIRNYFSDSIRQFEVHGYIYDWFCPSHNLLIEFNESHHKQKQTINKDNLKHKSIKTMNIFIINEESVMRDLSDLTKKFRGN